MWHRAYNMNDTSIESDLRIIKTDNHITKLKPAPLGFGTHWQELDEVLSGKLLNSKKK